MNNHLHLKQFVYSIPPSTMALAWVKKNNIFAEHLPLMKVSIDFANGNMRLEGNWQFMISSNKHNDSKWSRRHSERIQIEAALSESAPVDLNDTGNDSFVFSLDGTIKDGATIAVCTGLLILDRSSRSNDLIGCQWDISFYLYDLQLDDCEIKFKLPVCLDLFDSSNN